MMTSCLLSDFFNLEFLITASGKKCMLLHVWSFLIHLNQNYFIIGNTALYDNFCIEEWKKHNTLNLLKVFCCLYSWQ